MGLVKAGAWLVTLVLFASVGTALANRSDLVAFLERTERMGDYQGPLRADIRVLRADSSVDEAVLIVSPQHKRQFLAFKSTGWRALLPIGWGTGKAVEEAGGKATAYGVDEPLGGTGLRAIEFFPFWQADYATAFISDSNRLEKTVTLYAPKSVPYVLFVITFDKAKLVPLAAKYYKNEMSNLVRMRKDSEHVMVGSRPRPQKIEINDYAENTKTILELSWKVLDSVPVEIMDEARFGEVKIDWRGPTVAAR
jgi:hypothetical protein